MFRSAKAVFKKVCALTSVSALVFLSLLGAFSPTPNFAENPESETPMGPSRMDELKDALKSDQALPDTIFGIRRDANGNITGGCKVPFSPSQTDGGSNSQSQNQVNRDVLIGCIGSIIRLLFIVAVVITIVKVAAAQLGIVAFGGDDSSQGGSVVLTRKYLVEGLIGIAMVAGAMLILQLFNTNFSTALDRLFGGS